MIDVRPCHLRRTVHWPTNQTFPKWEMASRNVGIYNMISKYISIRMLVPQWKCIRIRSVSRGSPSKSKLSGDITARSDWETVRGGTSNVMWTHPKRESRSFAFFMNTLANSPLPPSRLHFKTNHLVKPSSTYRRSNRSRGKKINAIIQIDIVLTHPQSCQCRENWGNRNEKFKS